MVNGRTEAEDMAARHGEPPQWPCPICGKYIDCCSCHYRASDVIVAMRRLVQEIERLRTAEPRWIPVAERLPELYRSVIGWKAKWCGPAEVWLDDHGQWRLRGSMLANGITHWMPLPAPPEEPK